MKNKESGMTLAEVAVAAGVAVLVLTSVVTAAVPLMARENLRSATYQLQSTLQVSRVEAVARNTDTRFVLNTNTRTVESWDTKGTADKADDVLLRKSALPGSVSLVDPDHGAAVTIAESKTELGVYESVFAGDGSVTEGTGKISIQGGGMVKKLVLTAAGGVDVSGDGSDAHGKSELSAAEIRGFEKKWELLRETHDDDVADDIEAELQADYEWDAEQERWVKTESLELPDEYPIDDTVRDEPVLDDPVVTEDPVLK